MFHILINCISSKMPLTETQQQRGYAWKINLSLINIISSILQPLLLRQSRSLYVCVVKMKLRMVSDINLLPMLSSFKKLPLFCTLSVLANLWQISDCHKHLPLWTSRYAYLGVFNIAHTCTVAYSFVFNDVIMLQWFKYFNFSFKIPKMLFCAMLQLFHSNHLPSIIL